MSLVKHLIYFLLLQLVIASPQINLYLTDWINDNIHDTVQQHHCLYADLTEIGRSSQIISYCLSESASNVIIGSQAIFTFSELKRRNITSAQLYRWSAPIDTSENYQLYLELSSFGQDLLEMGNLVFYNCSSPTFGPVCQYVLDAYDPSLSLNENIRDHYSSHFDEQKSSSCYTHLRCDRGSTSICLDWSEICDGKIDCTNGADESDCWPLATNQCNDGEYRCDNGQCIPYRFVNDHFQDFECLDRSDEYGTASLISRYEQNVPTFQSEDVVCSWRKNRMYASLELHPFTSSCINQRHTSIEQAILSDRSDATMSISCLLAVRCLLRIPADDNSVCLNLCENDNCTEIIENFCPDMFYYPTVPIAFGHIYFAYTRRYITNWTSVDSIPPTYICYNEQLCGGFHSNATLISFKGNTCRRLEDLSVSFHPIKEGWYPSYIRLVYSQFGHCNPLVNDGNSMICNHSTMYQCRNSSKCISKSYVGDGIRDCDHKDDEEQTTIDELCWTDRTNVFFKCETDNKCIHRSQVEDGICNCRMDENGLCDDENLEQNRNKRQINYSTLCDGFLDLLPVMINGQQHTDETNCEQWPCNNTYTRCDGLWTCLDGGDEVDCNPSPSIQCPPRHHICVSLVTNQLMCLSLAEVNDGTIDCLGGIDESRLCPVTNRFDEKKFHCRNNGSDLCILRWYVCDRFPDCENGDDERFCNSTINHFFQTNSNTAHTLLKKSKSRQKMISQLSMIDESEPHCNRGFPVRVLLDIDNNLSNTTCFCPPSYYGDRCQFQNQRVSLTMQLNVSSQSRQTLFVLLISLIDDSAERVIHSYQRLSYFYMRDQHTKFNTYLLYSTRPKDRRKNYAVHIDIYEMITLNYRGSLLVPVKFPFLPVERLAVELNIPQTTERVPTCTDRQCIHGQCIRYLNDFQTNSFCQCNTGWTGKYCSIPQMCTCSFDSLCVGVAANNRSICVCSLNKFGSRCLLTNTVCQDTSCLYGGLCVPSDEHSASPDPYICVCRKGYSGKRCEVFDTRITLRFDSEISLPSRSLGFLHFIHLVNDTPFIHTKRPSIICKNQTSIVSYEPPAFQMAFLELWMNQYYFIVNHKVDYQSSSIARVIHPSDRCQSIHELLDQSIVRMPLIQRIKYYHIPCQYLSINLSCFFDEVHMCLCGDFGGQRLANCFEFDHHIRLDDLDSYYEKIQSQCSTDYLFNSSSSTTSMNSAMSSISACKCFLHLFILLFYLYIHYRQ